VRVASRGFDGTTVEELEGSTASTSRANRRMSVLLVTFLLSRVCLVIFPETVFDRRAQLLILRHA
jgi:hypothetical protein